MCRLLPLELRPRMIVVFPWVAQLLLGLTVDGDVCCQQVLDYSVGLSRVWPDLEQSMRANDLDWQLSPNGTGTRVPYPC